MLKNVMQTVRIIVCCAVVVVSPYAYAEVTYIPVEIKCSNNPMAAQWITFAGDPGVQYTITTEGLREDGKEGVAEVVRTRYVGRTRDGLHMFAAARCVSSPNTDVDISLTGSSLECSIGDGIEATMLEPNSSNPDKYHYVGTLAVVRSEGNMLGATGSNATIIGEEQLQSSKKAPCIVIGFNSYVY